MNSPIVSLALFAAILLPIIAAEFWLFRRLFVTHEGDDA